MKDVPGEKEMGDKSKMDTSNRKSEESVVNNAGKAEAKVKKPWWMF